MQTQRTCSTFEIWSACGRPFGIADANCGANPTVTRESKPIMFSCVPPITEAEKPKSATVVAGFQTFNSDEQRLNVRRSNACVALPIATALGHPEPHRRGLPAGRLWRLAFHLLRVGMRQLRQHVPEIELCECCSPSPLALLATLVLGTLCDLVGWRRRM